MLTLRLPWAGFELVWRDVRACSAGRIGLASNATNATEGLQSASGPQILSYNAVATARGAGKAFFCRFAHLTTFRDQILAQIEGARPDVFCEDGSDL